MPWLFYYILTMNTKPSIITINQVLGGLMRYNLVDACKEMFCKLESMPMKQKVETLNALRLALSEYSPFKSEPVDCVQWVPNTEVTQNDYNPNSVAPPEMKLLELSIQEDGYTQPIVSWARDNIYEVIDGFHRHRVGKESKTIHSRIHGYLPLVVINKDRQELSDRMASTIRHNRARGKHGVDSMSDIVVELKKRNRSDEWIAKHLGMDLDEVLRLCQISGIAELFVDSEFSKSWDVEDLVETDFNGLEEDDVEIKVSNRILHTYDKWECYPAGFYESKAEGLSKEQCEEIYKNMLSDIPQFEAALQRVITEWPRSCEHYLTNENMNRIAWLGQASLCIAHKIPAVYRGGFTLLTPEQQQKANETALKYLNKWLVANNRPTLNMEDAQSKTEANIY